MHTIRKPRKLTTEGGTRLRRTCAQLREATQDAKILASPSTLPAVHERQGERQAMRRMEPNLPIMPEHCLHVGKACSELGPQSTCGCSGSFFCARKWRPTIESSKTTLLQLGPRGTRTLLQGSHHSR